MYKRALFALLMFTFATGALADPRQELHSAFVNNLALTSYRATMTDLSTNKVVSTVEFHAPDRFRVTAAGQPQASVIVGGKMYLNINGHSMAVPFPKDMLAKYRNQETLDDLENGLVVESLGPGLVGKEAARKYRFTTSGKHPSVVTAWIGVRANQVLQIETSGKAMGKATSMRIVYSDFNSPAIRISAPN